VRDDRGRDGCPPLLQECLVPRNRVGGNLLPDLQRQQELRRDYRLRGRPYEYGLRGVY